jgi:hypothetical protein
MNTSPANDAPPSDDLRRRFDAMLAAALVRFARRQSLAVSEVINDARAINAAAPGGRPPFPHPAR